MTKSYLLPAGATGAFPEQKETSELSLLLGGLTHGVVWSLPVDVIQELLQERCVVLQWLQVLAVVPCGQNGEHEHDVPIQRTTAKRSERPTARRVGIGGGGVIFVLEQKHTYYNTLLWA